MTTRVRSVRLPVEVEDRLRVVGQRFGWSVSRALLRAVERGLPELEGPVVEIGGVRVIGDVNVVVSGEGVKAQLKPQVVQKLRSKIAETEQRMAVTRKHRMAYPSSSACKDCGATRGLVAPEMFITQECQ